MARSSAPGWFRTGMIFMGVYMGLAVALIAFLEHSLRTLDDGNADLAGIPVLLISLPGGGIGPLAAIVYFLVGAGIAWLVGSRGKIGKRQMLLLGSTLAVFSIAWFAYFSNLNQQDILARTYTFQSLITRPTREDCQRIYRLYYRHECEREVESLEALEPYLEKDPDFCAGSERAGMCANSIPSGDESE